MERKLIENISECDVSCIWTIDNFSTYENCELKSNLFTSYYDKKSVNWYIAIHPNGTRENLRDYLSILFCVKNNVYVELFVKFSILNSQMEKVESREMVVKQKMNNSARIIPMFISRRCLEDQRNDLLTDDKLVIMCEVSTNAFDIISDYSKSEIKAAVNRVEEFDEFEKMFCNDTFSDVILSVGGEKLPAHKIVLASRSSVFEKILEERKNERITNIEIKNVRFAVMKELLRFIYAGKVNDVNEIAFDLLDAANTYKIRGMTSLCYLSLRKTLNNENAIEYFTLSHAYRAHELKDDVIDYIVQNSTDIVQLPSFHSVSRLNSSLLHELLQAVMQKE